MDDEALKKKIAADHPEWKVGISDSGVARWIDILASGRHFTIEWVPGTEAGVSELLPTVDTGFSGHDEAYGDLEDALAHVERELHPDMDEETVKQRIVGRHPSWKVTVHSAGPAACKINIAANGRHFAIEWILATKVGVRELPQGTLPLDLRGQEEQYAYLEAALAHVARALQSKPTIPR